MIASAEEKAIAEKYNEEKIAMQPEILVEPIEPVQHVLLEEHAPTDAPFSVQLITDEIIEKIATKVAHKLSQKILEDIAWQVIPDLAEKIIKNAVEKLPKKD